jgi:hypothetical protein
MRTSPCHGATATRLDCGHRLFLNGGLLVVTTSDSRPFPVKERNTTSKLTLIRYWPLAFDGMGLTARIVKVD